MKLCHTNFAHPVAALHTISTSAKINPYDACADGLTLSMKELDTISLDDCKDIFP